ncbi:ABC transporter permease [Actinomadura madurae]|uniref:ABC transporter permease n=1 Tax=Actinomadura madurae TaxID=1993 RepID=UPI000D88D811|nr:ABC transporter permease [Actinomadura madurae]URM93890.1 ABC transporter permease [Actinomadura madurae]URN04615.1 ABC transporter permease [Actinomadura madurae]SPT57461.1 Glutathione transport system permease protein gsiC [Actinomadura madurae]
MLRIVGKRILAVVPMLWAIATIAFYLVNLIPGSPGRTILGDAASQEQVDALNHRLGHDRPLLVQYGDWLAGAVRGDFGDSLQSGRSAVGDVATRLPITLSIAIAATVISVVIGVLVGVAAANGGRWLDRVLQGGSSVAMAVPSFWLGVLLVFVFALGLEWLPAVGYVPFTEDPGEWLKSIVLPSVSVAMIGTATVGRQTRAALIHELGQDYIRTLYATGVPARSIVLKHALRNASTPIATTVGFQFIGLLGSTVIVEQVFGINGLGQLVLGAVTSKDLPLLLTVIIFTTAMVIAVNLIVDLLTVWLNPKARRA